MHIEAHGNKTGLKLADEKDIDWQELKAPLSNLNIATQNNLLIVLGACYGADISSMILPYDRAPCWGLIAPTEEMDAGPMFDSFHAFYSKLLETYESYEAIKALNELIKPPAHYFMTTSEMLFEEAFKSYFIRCCTGPELKKRALKIRNDLIAMGAAIVPDLGTIKRGLKKTKKTFERYKRTFFMIDLYPENERRFRIKYSDIET